MYACPAEDVGAKELSSSVFRFSITMTKGLGQVPLLGLCLGLKFGSPNVKLNDLPSNVNPALRQAVGAIR